LINDDKLTISVVSSERLVNSTVIVYFIKLSIEEGTSSTAGSEPNKELSSIIVKRRYSEFKSLRDTLAKLFPTLIIPPIPEKHSLFSYLVNSINNNNELNIIEMRKRYFTIFLNDLIFNSDEKLKNCVLVHKFFDPNYESCWSNALNEPPANLIPNSLLLANPTNTCDQNGLYSLLPVINGFEFNSEHDNLSSLKKINDDLAKLQEQKKLFYIKKSDLLKENKDSFELSVLNEYNEVPSNLIQFEVKIHKILRILNELNKVNNKTTKDYKGVIHILMDLGANLNNFSLQVFDNTNIGQATDNNLSIAIEKFGSSIDSNFLNHEGFVINHLIPEWQEPVHQIIQYYMTSMNLIKFYKYKIIQLKLLYKLKFNKFQDLINLLSANTITSNETMTQTLDHLKDLDSPTINQAVQKMQAREKQGKGLATKKSWYGLFGGNNSYNKQYSRILEEHDDGASQLTSESSPYKFKLNQIEKELNKLNQLINLCNNDMINFTKALTTTYTEFVNKMEKKWLQLMIQYLRNGKKLFEENLSNLNDLKVFLTKDDT